MGNSSKVLCAIEHPLVVKEDRIAELTKELSYAKRVNKTYHTKYVNLRVERDRQRNLKESAEKTIVEEKADNFKLLLEMSDLKTKLKMCRKTTGLYRQVVRQYEENTFVRILKKLKLINIQSDGSKID